MVIDIERHDVTVHCMECVAGLRGQGGVHHSDTCRKRLTNVIGQGDGSHRAKRARQRELSWHSTSTRAHVLFWMRRERSERRTCMTPARRWTSMSWRRHAQHYQGRAAPAAAAASLEPGAQLQGKNPSEISVQRNIHHEITVAENHLAKRRN